ncbi:retention module-containing protein [Pseudomonas benzenivorans]|uniref:Retention module-containing protein n=1 Tax=Pseudomonas benzenivorans TaxID=556533 RepID=A0ABZ0PZS3_9PSED|nr:retention module-containing protein [Pseudomonas benzenivorans]WPC06717.1 retention module-containing protein [Pseudomonas benzenivorans]
MATLIGVVSQVVGEVFAVAGDGSRRPLFEGDRVYAGEQLVTGATGAVAVALSNGRQLTLGRDSSLSLSEQLLAQSADQVGFGQQSAVDAPSAQDLSEVEQLQAAIEAGVDPTVAGEATAAGPGAGGAAGSGGGGHSFVLLDETAGAVEPVIGFPTVGLSSGPEFPDPDPAVSDDDTQPADGTPVVEVEHQDFNGSVIVGPALVDEQALANGTNPSSPAEQANGRFIITSPDGVSALEVLDVNGVWIDVTNGGVVQGKYGILTVDAAGNWTYTLTNNTLDHSNPNATGADDQVGESFQVRVFDLDGDVSPIVLLDVLVNDDGPTLAEGEGAVVSSSVDEDDIVGGNPDGDAITNVASGAAGSLSALVNFGADGPGSFGLSSSPAALASLTAQGLTSGGTALTYSVVGNLLTASAGATTVFTLQVNGDGSYVFTLLGPLDHPLADGNDDELLSLPIDFSGLLTATDGDGDSIGAFNSGSFVINVEDDVPVAVVGEERPTINQLVHEDPLLSPHQGNSESGQTLTASGGAGALHVLVNFGADGPGSFGLSSNVGALTAQGLTSGGEALSYAVVGNTLTASVSGYEVFTLVVNADGSYLFTLKGPIDHPMMDGNDGETLAGLGIDFSGVLTATDGDGDPLVGGFPAGSFTIDVEDDVPVAANGEQRPTINQLVHEDPLLSPHQGNSEGGQTLTASGGAGALHVLVNFGADGPGSFGLSSNVGALTAQGLTSGGEALSYAVVGNTLTASVSGYEVFTLVVNADGSYLFTLKGPIDHPMMDGNDGETLAGLGIDFSGVLTATDGDGDPLVGGFPAGSFTIDVEDDVPVARLNDQAPDLGQVTVDESLPAFGGEGGDGIAMAVLSGALVQAQFDSSFGADGPGSTSYSLMLSGNGVPSGLFAVDASAPDGKGAQILLSQVGNVITGSVGAADYFTLTIDPTTGAVTLHLLDNIWHGDTTDHDDAQTLLLEPGVLKLVQTLTDGDGDSDSKSIDLGAAGVFRFEDDGPDASLNKDAPELGKVKVDESLPAFGGVGGDGIATAVLSGALVQVQFDSSFGADGPGSTSYSLMLSGNGVPSGLFAVDASAPDGKGAQILLSQVGNVITGSVGAADYFTLTIDPTTGAVTLHLLDNIWHGDTTDHDDAQTLLLDPGVLKLVQTLTDGDGDSDSKSIDLGAAGVFRFEDDGPDASLNKDAPELGKVKVDESLPAFGGVGGDGIATAVLSGALVQAQFDSSFGADGPGSTSYSLMLSGNGVPSGLFAVDASAPDGKGAQILLSQVGNVITGSVGAADYFTLTIDPTTGAVTLHLLDNIWHGDTSDHDDAQTLLLEPGVLKLVQTLTDGDGDSDSKSIDLGAAGVFRFEDDGPDASLNKDAPELGKVKVDESLPAFGGVGGDGIATAVLSGALVQAQFDSSFGADGPGSTSYSLMLSGNGVPSGLFAVDASAPDGKGAQILLSQVGNVITGSVGAADYFTLTIDPTTGAVTLHLLDNIWHGDTTDHDDAQTLLLEPGVLKLVQTLTDGDGDSDSKSIDLGAAGVFRFEDDGPDASLNKDAPELGKVKVDESLPAFGGVGGDGIATAVLSGALVQVQFDSSFGADGPGSTSYSLMLSGNGVPSGLFAVDASAPDGKGAQILLSQVGNVITGSVGAADYFTLTIDPTTGAVTLHLLDNIWHGDTTDHDDAQTLLLDPGVLKLVQTLTDGDGDSDSKSIDLGAAGVFRFEDDGPDASLNKDAPELGKVKVDESLPAFGGVGGDGIATAVLSGALVQAQFDSSFGADGPGSTSYSLMLSGNGVPSGLFAVDASAPDGKGAQILLSQVGNVITGSVGAADYFTLTIDPTTGAVTLHLLDNIWHGDTSDHDDAQTLLLEPGVLKLVQTLTDGDGDSDSKSIDLGAAGVFRFEDDGPDASLNKDAPELGKVKVDESLPAFGGVGGDGIATAVLSGALVQAQFDSSFGADGPGSTSYSLMLSGNGVPSGLFAVDASAPDGKGAQILLSQVGNVITGSVGAADYFTLTIDPTTGAVTLHLLDNIWHGDTTDHDDAQTLLLEPGVLKLVQTLTDGDGDSDSKSIDLGAAGVFRFEDDGPDASLNKDAPELGKVKVDESLPAFGGVGGDGIATAVLSGALVQVQFDSSFGADGPGSTSYSLMLSGNGVPSGLFAVDASAPDGKGAQILLSQVGNVITGSVGAADYFTLTIDPTTGAVTLHLLDNIWHGDTTDHDDAQTLLLEPGVLKLVQTLTDGDGDSDSKSIDLGAAGVFRFEDDGPDASLNKDAPELGKVKVDESLPAFGGVGGDGIATAVLSGALVQAQFDSSFGADGPGSTSYSLMLSGNGVPSGLFAVDASAPDGKGAQILLSQVGNVITGSVGAADYFTLTIDPTTGAVTLHLLDNIWHGDTTDHDDAQTLLLEPGVLKLVQTLTDGDGDSDSKSIDLGAAGVFRFEDDGPVQSGSYGQRPTVSGTVQEDALAVTGGAPHDGNAEGGQSTTASGGAGTLNALVNFGADGPGDFGLSDSPAAINSMVAQGLTSGGASLSYSVVGNLLTASVGAQTIFTLQVNVDGSYSFSLQGPLDHPLPGSSDDGQLLSLPIDFSGVLTATDGDGDPIGGFEAGSFTIDVEDDVPVARNDSATVLAGQSQDFNVAFVLDFSGSIDNTELNQMLQAVRAAGQALFNGTPGAVNIKLVAFSATATSYAQVTDFASLNSLIASLNPAEGGTRPFNGQTDFTDAIIETMSAYSPIPGWSNQVFFISDGNPNQQTGPGGTSLTAPVATAWNSFVNDNGISVTSIGVGNGISVARLQDIDVDGEGAPILVGDFDDLIDTLVGQVLGDVVSGNVLLGNDNAVGGGDDDAFGADGPGYIQSIEINGITYTWDGVGTIVASSGPNIAGSQLSDITTAQGGKLSFNFATGAWSYQAPSGINGDKVEAFNYIIVDNDGDPANATLTIYVEDQSPVVARVDEDELPGGITDLDAVNTVAVGSLFDLIVGPPVAAAQFSLSSDTSGLAMATSAGVPLVYSVSGDTLTAKAGPGGAVIFTLQVQANGDYTFNLLGPIDHPVNNSDDNELLTFNFASILLASDGSNPLALAGGFLVHIEDDVPTIITPDYAFLVNNIGQSATGVKLDIDKNIHDNMGADNQGGRVRFAEINGSDSGYTTNMLKIYLYVSADGQTLVGSTTMPGAGLDASSASVLANKAFTSVLSPDSGVLQSNDTYSFTLFKQIDGGVGTFTVKDVGFVFRGGNDPYAYFDDTITNDANGDQDVLLTPMVGGVSAGTMNTSSIAGGVGSGNSVGGGEGVRVDYVKGLSGNTVKNVSDANYAIAANQDHIFSGHNTVNGGFAVVTSTSGSTIRVKAFDDSDGNNIVGDGTPDKITRVQIAYNNAMAMVMVAGVTTVMVGGRSFTVTESGNDVLVSNVQGDSGNNPAKFTVISAFTDTGYTTLEFSHSGGDTFKLGGFGASTFDPGAAVELNFDLLLTDGDGDSVAIPDGIRVQLSPDNHILQTGTDNADVLQVSPGTSGTLVGLAGDDTLIGHVGNDILYGGLGNDTMTGGGGSDTFKWLLGENGTDTVTDFAKGFNSGGDRLDLSQLLVGENGAPGDIGNLLSYIEVSTDSLVGTAALDTVIKVDASGGGNFATPDQTIVLQDVNLFASYSVGSEADVILNMLADGTLKVDTV